MMRGGISPAAVVFCLLAARGGGGGVQAFVPLSFSPVTRGRTTNTAAPLALSGMYAYRMKVLVA